MIYIYLVSRQLQQIVSKWNEKNYGKQKELTFRYIRPCVHTIVQNSLQLKI